MRNIVSLKYEAETEAYAYFDKHIRPLQKTEDGVIENNLSPPLIIPHNRCLSSKAYSPFFDLT